MQRKFSNRVFQGAGVLVIGLLLGLLILIAAPGVRTALAAHAFGAGKAQIALTLRPTDATLLESIGHYYFGSGAYDLEQAERAYRRALALSPDTLWAHYQLGRIAFVRGDFDASLREFDLALEQNPANLRVLYPRALTYAYSGDWAQAENDFRRFIEWAPSEWGGYNDLSWVLLKKGELEASAQVARQGIATATQGATNPWLWNAQGVALYQLEQYSEAAEAFARAQQYAVSLTEGTWRSAYSANDPKSAARALVDFRLQLAANKDKAQAQSEAIDNTER